MTRLQIQITSLFLLFNFFAISQTAEINVKVLQGFGTQAKLYLYKGSQVELIDSSAQLSTSTYAFKLQQGYAQGLYRVDIGKGISFNIVVSDEPIIDITTTVFAPEDSLKSEQSIENTIYWKFQREKKRSSQHAWLIRSLIDYYPDSVMFHHLLAKELNIQQQQLFNMANAIFQHYPNLLSARYIFTEQTPLPPPFTDVNTQTKILKDIWWENIDFFDDRLLNSPALSKRIWGYIELYYSEDFDKEEQEQSFIQGINSLLNLEMQHDVKLYIRDLLTGSFSVSDYMDVLDFLETAEFEGLKPLKEPISDDACKVSRQKVGDKAYDFFIDLNDGKRVKLSKLKADYKLLIFWSSWCPHCIELLPKIAELKQEYQNPRLEIVAISIDDEEWPWRDQINKFTHSWIDMHEPFSTESKILKMYNVEETPKMLLLSRDLTIISIPSTLRQLEQKLKRLVK